MGHYLFTDDEFNRLSDTRRIAGAFVNVAIAGSHSANGEQRAELRVSEVIAVFDLIERHIAEVLKTAEQRYTVEEPTARRGTK